MTDFIREVDEEVRRDKTIALVKRLQVPLAVLAIGIVGGAGAYRYWADGQVTKAEQVNTRYTAADDLLKAGKAAEAQAAFTAIVQEGAPGYAMLSRSRAAAALQANDPEAAAKAFDAIANDSTVAASMRDAARLRGAMIRVDSAAPADFEKMYGRFSVPGFAFASSMRELLAMAAMKRQDFEAAGKYLDEIILDGSAPAALRGRAQALRGLADAGPATPMNTQPPPAQAAPPPGAAPEASDIPATTTLPAH